MVLVGTLRERGHMGNLGVYGNGKGKGKVTPLQALRGPEDSRSLRLPDFNTIGT
jgi:hypothetical protein